MEGGPSAGATPMRDLVDRSASVKRRRVAEALLTPLTGQNAGEYVNQEDQEVYINTYGRANLVKSEFIEASEAKDAVIEGHRKELAALRRRLGLLEGEKAAAVAKSASLEQEVETRALRERTEAELAGGNAADAAAATESEALKLARGQQAKLRALVEMKARRGEELEEAVAGLESWKRCEAQERREASAELDRLRLEVEALRGNGEGNGAAERRISALESRLVLEEDATAAAEARLKDALAEAERQGRRALEAENAALGLRKELVDASSSSAPVADLERQVRHLEKELQSQSREVAAARALRGKLQSEGVLVEKLAQAQARAERAEGALAEATASQAEADAVRADAETWRSILVARFGEGSGPHDVVRKFDKAERRVVELLEECGRARVEAKAASGSVGDLETSLRSTGEEGAALRQMIEELRASALRQDRKVTLLQKERDGLKRIIASYDDEEVLLTRAGAGEGAGKQHAVRVAELEDALEAQRAQAAKLESELRESQDKAEDLMSKNEALRSEGAEAKSRVGALEQERSMMARELASTSQELSHLKAEQDSRILHLASNPEQKARRDHVNGLMAEVASLREALRSQGQGGGATDAEVAKLKKQLESLSKRESRLKSAFQDRISLFIDACYAIFGYRIDMTTENKETRFVLRPMHEERESLNLIFKFESNAAELVPTEYSETMQREVDTFIGRYKTIPAFTANLTMDIFNKQTQV